MNHKEFNKGDYVIRKGCFCVIEKIHYEMDPPSVTVRVLHNNDKIGTEFKYLTKPIVEYFNFFFVFEINTLLILNI